MNNWHQRALDLRIDGRAFINGERCAALDLQTFERRSPLDGRVLGAVTRGQAADVNVAVKAAHKAFEDGRWSRQPPAARKKVLLAFAEGLLAAREELALLETLDMGKPIGYALSIDVPAAAHCIAWYAEALDKIYGQIAPTGPQALALVQREPVGVVAALLPWSYPLVMSAWKIAPALAAGNSVVLKPSEKSPLSALRMAEIALQAGVPPGVLSVVPGYGFEAGEALALHSDVAAITLAGTVRTGRRLLECAAHSNLKRVYAELGGKSAFIVLPDCADPDLAARTAAAAMFFNQGESCNAPSRVLVHESLADEFVRRLTAEAPRYAPEDPLDEDTVMGALVGETHMNQVLDHVNAGQQEGAQLVAGGRRVRVASGGFYVEPTVFDHVHMGMRIATEEIFGPVMSVLRFRDEADALAQANADSFGLQASVWTQDLDRAHRMARALRVGTVHINQYDQDDMTVPFGGVKQSGDGRDKSLHALDMYTALKTTWLRLQS